MESQVDDSSHLTEMTDEGDHGHFLLGTIDEFLRGETSVEDFRTRFYDYYIDVLPEWALSDRERDFYGSVQEKLDWVDRAPDALSRADGWIDHDD